MSEHDTRRGTSAHTPDLDWSQVRETVLMLELAVGQIEAAMKEGHSSVEVLTDSFTSMAGYMRMIAGALEQLPDTPATQNLKDNLIGHAGEVSGRIQRSIIAFQFYDKLTQRLAHVSHSLEALSGLVVDQRKLYNPFEWVALQEKIRAKYSTREEVDMFNAVMQGMPVKDALEKYKAGLKDKGDDVELF
ncbi:MAG TPA: hypothetical protein PLN96_12795 [Zoogloea sp.]|uniref:hypothetical protein n=1 Tax=Zoogloea sp. TaxID=49181 RepID=UPI002C786EA1|nr:hypothetical protein [Zoogloea sp.]HMV18517.1 hypothetical protein [Rhodocyclaceae bacterium]HMV64226.1 hypothetical protein [Rhodocyclaceae bacterium]HMW53120.1 hypothetical protein [Rhodocyclaceae bacterium]HMY51078.1 hypothetical protein [Rhodocyclaceae bacterium]HMZ77211.1 hypothetical protein [Rhodocyclaceae bacterium]